MLAYYQAEPATISVPSGMIGPDAINPVKSLVCSPDLTMFATPSCSGEIGATTAATEGKYQCLLCQKSFAQKSVYQSHLRSHGKDGEGPYRCNICGKTFAVPARLTRHYRTHTGEKPYQCEYCSKSFSVKENLSVHRRIHTKERPYKCDVCGRAFEHSGKLHRHMRIHTGERPHKCTVCSKTFIQSGQLVIHMRTHTGEKPYVCKSCKKGFTCSKQLKVHTRTHTGEKPYTCDICRKAFGYNHVLKLHQVSHYGEKVYKCTICNETFGSKKTMELHIKKHPDSSVAAATAVITEAPAAGSPIEPDISQGGGGAALPTDDKENLKTEEPESYVVQRDFAYYLYPSSREQQQQYAPGMSSAEPVLTEIDEKRFQASVRVSSPLEPPHMFFFPEPTYTGFGLAAGSVGLDAADCSSLLNLPGNDARRRVEAALEAVEEERQRECGSIDPLLTPPSSNPSSPDPLDLAVPSRETLILPPRKRSKMILQSMESERSGGGLIAVQRQSSVIQFARAS
ncbi:PREDICTED: Krueppel homolog 1-like [Dinoponera quadriceps]|uniref:Krueppel homolog 1-like n=1 Tax=Dinoponera quadriceps TaxID=609295 RepID=A0A6P3X4G4_DINQU|nr:PREDICTED: Krueppel homolog 1-like [Dinoponera quadriceps]